MNKEHRLILTQEEIMWLKHMIKDYKKLSEHYNKKEIKK